jgi:hypothetical protein
VAKEVAGDEGLFPFERVHLQRLLLAADVILELSGEGPVSDVLEAELPIDRTSGRHADGKAVCAAA